MTFVSALQKITILTVLAFALFTISSVTVLAAPGGHGNQGGNNHGGQGNNNHDNDHHDNDNHGNNDHHDDYGSHDNDDHHGNNEHGDDHGWGDDDHHGDEHNNDHDCEVDGQVWVDGECQDDKDPVEETVTEESTEHHHSAPISSRYKDKSKSSGEVLGAEDFQFNNNLRLGMNISPDVLELQKRLSKEGFFNDVQDGQFGQSTFEAVKAYQTAHSTIGYVTGFFGPLTRAEMNTH